MVFEYKSVKVIQRSSYLQIGSSCFGIKLIQTNLTSAIRTDYSWMRPSRRGWHMDAIMPGMTPGEEIDVVVSISTKRSISDRRS